MTTSCRPHKGRCLEHDAELVDAEYCMVGRGETQQEAADRQRREPIEWVVPIAGVERGAVMTVDRACDVTLMFLHEDGEHIAALALTPIEASQLGVVLLEVARVAGAERAKQRDQIPKGPRRKK